MFDKFVGTLEDKPLATINYIRIVWSNTGYRYRHWCPVSYLYLIYHQMSIRKFYLWYYWIFQILKCFDQLFALGFLSWGFLFASHHWYLSWINTYGSSVYLNSWQEALIWAVAVFGQDSGGTQFRFVARRDQVKKTFSRLQSRGICFRISAASTLSLCEMNQTLGYEFWFTISDLNLI